MSGPALFRETQRFVRNPWAVVGALAALAGGCSPWIALGATPVAFLGLAVGLGVAALLAFGALHTEVRPDGLYVRFVPFTRQHRFAWSEIASAEARDYRPILEYGGWGIRWSGQGKAYNVHGHRGVQLVLADGRRLLVGSQEADTLARAIASARGR